MFSRSFQHVTVECLRIDAPHVIRNLLLSCLGIIILAFSFPLSRLGRSRSSYTQISFGWAWLILPPSIPSGCMQMRRIGP